MRLKQKDNNNACALMYLIRDSLNDSDVRTAITLVGELNRMLMLIAVNDEVIDCILDCKTEIKGSE